MALPYDHRELEARWRARWEAQRLYQVDVERADRDTTLYCCAEFPYPSAEGLHVGHVFRYGGVDAYARLWRMRGRAVFQPIGFDSFGIHTENYALRVGQHPAVVTERTTTNFRRQLSAIGVGWDWSRVLSTSSPEYYRWTQWLFLRLWEAGLAYEAEAPVLWCPSCATVLAAEQVEDDRCERCSTLVTQRVMRQWFLRITAYAERLLDGLDGLDWPARAKRGQRQWIGRTVDADGNVRLRLHDWLISRQRYWGPPIPIIHCAACGAVGVPDAQLPVLLPEIARLEDLRPTAAAQSPLAAVPAFVHTTCPACGGPARRETDVSDTFFDSAWYFLRYPSSDVEDRPWDPDRTVRLLPVDFYAGGSEHVARHHLYARFITMALHDLDLVPFEEPFRRLRLGGLITKAGAKMSKSRGNVVDPDAYLDAHGADVLRCHLLFCGGWEQGGEFRGEGIAGIERFFTRVWWLFHAQNGPVRRARPASGPLDMRVLDRSVAAITADLDQLHCNTAIASMMELAGWAAHHRAAMTAPQWDRARRTLVLLLAPVAPHLAEELWELLGGIGSVHVQPWPRPDRAAVVDDEIDLVVQVDGRVRDRMRVPSGLDAPSARARVLASDRVVRALHGRAVQRVVHVQDRLVNLVTTRSGVS